MSERDGPHHICPRCGEISDPSKIDVEARVLRCVHCGHGHRYELLPPILFLTGASGSGKTTVFQRLTGTVEGAILIDHDYLWGFDPAHDDPATDYRLFRTRVFDLGMRLASNGLPVVIEGTTTPEQYERLPARPLVSNTSYLLLVCDDDVLAQRLRARPLWRRWSDDAIAGMVQVNRTYRTEAAAWVPQPTVVDTTLNSVDETAAAVREWIYREARLTPLQGRHTAM